MEYDFPPYLAMYKSLLELILEAIQQPEPTISSVPLSLFFLQVKPHLYLCDQHTSIFAIFMDHHHKSPPTLDPFNRLSTPYYNSATNKSFLPFNFPHLIEPTNFPHPYAAYFHFKTNPNQYNQFKCSMSDHRHLEGILVTKWSVKIVNVSNTGYYAPILQVLASAITKGKAMDVMEIYSVLHGLQDQFQQKRLYDIRSQHKPQAEKKISLSFNLRSTQRKVKKISNFVALDTEMHILKYEQHRDKHYIPFNSLEGACYFQKPLNHQNCKVIQQRNYFDMSGLCNRPVKDGVMDSIDSDSIGSNEPIDQQFISESKSSGSSSNEDPLRNLYLHQIQNDI